MYISVYIMYEDKEVKLAGKSVDVLIKVERALQTDENESKSKIASSFKIHTENFFRISVCFESRSYLCKKNI